GCNFQVKEQLRQLIEPRRRRLDGQGGNDGKARRHGQQGGQYGGSVGQNQGQKQHAGSILLQPGNGRGDKSNNNQGHTKVNQGAQQLLHRLNHLHDLGAIGKFRGPQPQGNAHHSPYQQAEGQTFLNIFHTRTPFSHKFRPVGPAHTASASQS